MSSLRYSSCQGEFVPWFGASRPLGGLGEGLGRNAEHAVGEKLGPLLQLGDSSNETMSMDGVIEHLFLPKHLHYLIGHIVVVLLLFTAVDNSGLLSSLGKVKYAA